MPSRSPSSSGMRRAARGVGCASGVGAAVRTASGVGAAVGLGAGDGWVARAGGWLVAVGSGRGATDTAEGVGAQPTTTERHTATSAVARIGGQGAANARGVP